MKPLLLTPFILLLFISQVSAQSIERGDLIIDAYYGFLHPKNSELEGILINSDADIFSVKSLGPIGGRGEYLLSNKFGLGVDIMYSYIKVDYTYIYAHSSGESIKFENYASEKGKGIILTFSYHFIKHKALDAYLVAGAGYIDNKVFLRQNKDTKNQKNF